jgi:hypothetical protein
MLAKMPTILLCVLALGIAACERKGPVERTGEKVDHMADTIRNGGEEPMRDKIQGEADRARDKAADAKDKVEGR